MLLGNGLLIDIKIKQKPSRKALIVVVRLSPEPLVPDNNQDRSCRMNMSTGYPAER